MNRLAARGGWVRGVAVLGCVLGIWSLPACDEAATSTELSLRDGLVQEFQGFTGVTISDDEAECLDSYLSDALGISFPATWSAYRQAMQARLTTIVSAFESSGAVDPDPLPGEATNACFTDPHKDIFFALSLVPPNKWSDLSEAQRSCLLASAARFHRSVPAPGIRQEEIRETCAI